MPTNKEKIMIYLDKKTKTKFQYLCKQEERSMVNYITRLIDKEIIKYEIEHGEIKIN